MKVLFLTIVYIAMSPKTTVSPSHSLCLNRHVAKDNRVAFAQLVLERIDAYLVTRKARRPAETVEIGAWPARRSLGKGGRFLRISVDNPTDDRRGVGHFDDIRHVACRTCVENRVGNAVRALRLDFEDARLERSRIERNRLARFKIDDKMRVSRLEIVQERNKTIDIVTLARDVVTAAKVHPLHLREEFAELLLETNKDFLEFVKPLFAKAVEMKPVKS